MPVNTVHPRPAGWDEHTAPLRWGRSGHLKVPPAKPRVPRWGQAPRTAPTSSSPPSITAHTVQPVRSQPNAHWRLSATGPSEPAATRRLVRFEDHCNHEQCRDECVCHCGTSFHPTRRRSAQQNTPSTLLIAPDSSTLTVLRLSIARANMQIAIISKEPRDPLSPPVKTWTQERFYSKTLAVRGSRMTPWVHP